MTNRPGDSTMKSPLPERRLRFGHVPIDAVTFAGALERIEEMVESGTGGRVFTPNVDHIMIAEEDARLRRAYQTVELSLADGMPLVWASHLFGSPLPAKVSGSDMAEPVMDLAARKGWRVYLLGGGPGIAAQAAERLKGRLPALQIVGTSSPRIDMTQEAAVRADILAEIKALSPHIVLVGLGAPKQELWIEEVIETLRPAVLLGFGAAIDFMAGSVRRAPRWASEMGLEWAYRLMREPRRLWRRYLLRDSRFLALLVRELRASSARAG